MIFIVLTIDYLPGERKTMTHPQNETVVIVEKPYNATDVFFPMKAVLKSKSHEKKRL